MCENKVSYHVPHGYGYREVFTPCGRTDHRGERAICQDCLDDPGVMRDINNQEETIRLDNQASHSAGWGDW